MSITSGFFNSINGDRKYDAEIMSSMFDGIMLDGVLSTVGNCFTASVGSNNNINIGTGKAWFNHTWIKNDSVFVVEPATSDILLDRIDTIVFNIDTSDAVRADTIQYIQGTAASAPVKPTMVNTETKHQYPICFITRAANSTTIEASHIENAIGTETTPIITGPLQPIDLDVLLGQWRGELNEFVTTQEDMFNEWFTYVQDVLDDDAAGNLLNLVNAVDTKADNGVFLYEHQTHESNTTWGILEGPSGTNGKFKAMASVRRTGFGVRTPNDYVYYTVVNGDETEIELIENNWYQFILDEENNTINFKSGGTALNYKIIGGTTQPSNAKENTIWIDTDTDINSYAFSFENPYESPQTGDVWIKTVEQSKKSINVLKKNQIVIYPISAYQYINDEWVFLECSLYQDNEWKSMGVNIYPSDISDFTNDASGTLNVDSEGRLELWVQGPNDWTSSYGSFHYNEKIDFTYLSTITIHYWTNYVNGRMYIKSNVSDTSQAVRYVLATNSETTASVDVSNLVGEYYVTFAQSSYINQRKHLHIYDCKIN